MADFRLPVHQHQVKVNGRDYLSDGRGMFVVTNAADITEFQKLGAIRDGGVASVPEWSDATGTALVGPDGVAHVIKPLQAMHSVASASGVPSVMDSGNALTLRDTLATIERDGDALTGIATTGSAAWYLQTLMPSNVTRIGAEFSFDAGTTTGGVVALVSFASLYTSAVPDSGLHFTISRYGWRLGKFVSTVLTQYADKPFTEVLAADTLYRVDISVAGDTATIYLPDGTVATVTDAAIESLAAPVAVWESFRLAAETDDNPRITKFWAGTIDQVINRPYLASDPSYRVYAAKLPNSTDAIPASTTEITDAGSRLPVPGLSPDNLLIEAELFVTSMIAASLIWEFKQYTLDGTLRQTNAFTVHTAAYTGRLQLRVIIVAHSNANPKEIAWNHWITAPGGNLAIASDKQAVWSIRKVA